MRIISTLFGSLFAWSSLDAAPVITGADHHALPEGETITLTGSGFEGATSAWMFWAGFNFPTTVTPVNDTTLEVVMPTVFQSIRDHFLLVTTPTGSTVTVPPNFIEVTSEGSSSSGGPSAPVVSVVRAGGTANGGANLPVVIETGGVLTNRGRGIIIAADGAVVDFTGVGGGGGIPESKLFRSPETVIIGQVPNGMTVHELPSITVSSGIESFTVGYGIDLTVVGEGSVSVSPDQTYFRPNTSVTLTATPEPGSLFSSWSGFRNAETNPLTISAGNAPIALTASFSTGLALDVYEIPGVTIEISPDVVTHVPGSIVTLTASVDPGYEFFHWAGDASGTALTTAVTMDGSKTVMPVVRPLSDAAIPQISGADYFALPEGETITLSGTMLGEATAAQMFWAAFDFPTSVTPVNETTLEVVMPFVAQGIRDHILLVETPTGSTVTIPSNSTEVTSSGISGGGPGALAVVRAGGRLGGILASIVVVETGGVLANAVPRTIFAENGAVVDFTAVTSAPNSRFFYSPNTVIIGAIPSGMIARELTSIRVSHGIGAFTVGYGIDVSIVGEGSVNTDPDQTYYRSDTDVTLTATPGVNQIFTGWSGFNNSSSSVITVRAGSGPIALTANFSTGWELAVYDIPGVTVDVSPDLSVHASGSVVELTATVEPGYEFFGWEGDAFEAGLVTSVTMNENLTIMPIVRPLADAAIPQITTADYYALPVGETITLVGSGLDGATAARMFWGSFDFPASVASVDETTLEVVMPAVFQEIREHVLLVEAPLGSTVAIPPVFREVTSAGLSGAGALGSPIVIRAGGRFNGGFGQSVIVVETGGVLKNPFSGTVMAENGAIVDFTGANPGLSMNFFYSPGTVIVGAIPDGVVAEELTPIKASHDLGTFTVAYPLTITIEGPGTVSVSPEKEFYTRDESVTLTASPDAEAFFIRWIGGVSGNASSITVRPRGDQEIIARFSTAPSYFSTWRPEHFTNEELGDLSVSGLDADPDNDGLSNAAEYALGSDPRETSSERSLKLKLVSVDGERRAFIEYYRPKNALDVAYVLLVSSDGNTWISNEDDPEVTLSIERSVEDVDETTELVTMEVYPDNDLPNSMFVRMSADLF